MISSDLLYRIASIPLLLFLAIYFGICSIFNRYTCSICNGEIEIDEPVVHKISIRNYAHVSCKVRSEYLSWRYQE